LKAATALLLLLSVAAALPTLAADAPMRPTLRIATVPILLQGDFLQQVMAGFAEQAGVELRFRPAPVKALAAGLRNGEFDLLLAHQDSFKVARLRREGVLGEPSPLFANPIAFIGPVDNPAGLRPGMDADAAMAAIAAGERCYVVNTLDGLADLQDALLEVHRPACVERAAGLADAFAMKRAATLGGYTLWGLHPFAQMQEPALAAMVLDDARLLRTIAAFAVGTAGARTDVTAAVAWLRGAEAQARAAAFRLPAAPATRAWWPVPVIQHPAATPAGSGKGRGTGGGSGPGQP